MTGSPPSFLHASSQRILARASRTAPPVDAALHSESAFAAALEGDDHPSASIVRRLREGLRLRAGEVDLLALCVSAEVDGDVAEQIARERPESGARGVPVAWAMRLFPEIDMAMLSANAPLRAWSLIALEPDNLRIGAHLRLVEPLLDRMLGEAPREPAIDAMFCAMPETKEAGDSLIARHLASTLAKRSSAGLSCVPCFAHESPARVAAALRELGLAPYRLSPEALAESAEARFRLFRAWERNALLDGAALIVSAPEDPQAQMRLLEAIESMLGHVVFIGDIFATCPSRSFTPMPVDSAPASRAVREWQASLGESSSRKLNGSIERVSHHFRLSSDQIASVSAEVAAPIAQAEPKEAATLLWKAASRAVSPRRHPAMRIIEPRATWDDIVLPERVRNRLEQLGNHVRYASTVFGQWGFGDRSSNASAGVAALFSGPSGTGKTMACEVLATSLMLPMIVVDLSQLISKFVGETSKNTAAMFQEAERSGAVMVWNEGDVVWGARGGVGNATDRHVNAEVGDLLERIENFSGFTIVTTNLKHAIDTAFIRRFRFMIDFPLPGEVERALIWQRAFPEKLPRKRLDWRALASLPLSGGAIRNAALNAAFAAAASNGPLDGEMLKVALAEELGKQDRSLPPIQLEMRAEGP